MSPAETARFPRSALMLEASSIAAIFRGAAIALDELAAEAHGFEPGTLRRRIRAITLAAVAGVVNCEGEP